MLQPFHSMFPKCCEQRNEKTKRNAEMFSQSKRTLLYSMFVSAGQSVERIVSFYPLFANEACSNDLLHLGFMLFGPLWTAPKNDFGFHNELELMDETDPLWRDWQGGARSSARRRHSPGRFRIRFGLRRGLLRRGRAFTSRTLAKRKPLFGAKG